MAKIVHLKRERAFSLRELNELLPIIIRITKNVKAEVDEQLNKLYSLSESGSISDESKKLESNIDKLIIDWQAKVKKLGGLPKGMWIVDFDAGDGYYCWSYPEDSIQYWHRYSQNYTQKILLSEKSVELGIADKTGTPDMNL